MQLRKSLREVAIARWGTWFSVGLILALAIYTQLAIRQSRYWVIHTFEVLDTVQQAEANFLDAQTALQKFLIDKNPLALARYQNGMEATDQLIRTLQQLTTDNLVQQQNIQQLSEKFHQQLRQQQNLIQQSQKVSQDQGSTAYSEVSLETVAQQITAIQEEERQLLLQRRAALDSQGTLATAVLLVGLMIVVVWSWRMSQEDRRQLQTATELNQRLLSIQQEQDLSNHLLTCRTFQEAHEILSSFLTYLLPESNGVLYEINNSRSQMSPTVVFGSLEGPANCSPQECWALRRGKAQFGQPTPFKIPCKLCQALHGDSPLEHIACLPLQAHEQTIGILHLSRVPSTLCSTIDQLAHQISLPLAVLHLQAKLEYLSFHDSNTGIYNRRFLDEMLVRAIAAAQRQNYLSTEGQIYSVGVIFMDVDHFKRFNSEHGHEMGDAVLRLLGAFLREMTRTGEDVPCRYGGEEFVLVMPGSSEEATLAKAEAIRQGIKQHPAANGATITLSLGVATYPKHGETPEEVLKAANIALLKAKAQGRDQVLLAV